MTDLLRDQLQTTLGASYTIARELGGGGMSRVFVARDEALGRDVVVKVLAPELAEGLSAERFAREIRLAAGLQEPHIVPVLGAGVTAEGLPYFTMPYVRGESLRARLTQGTVPLGEAITILHDIARALAYAHRQGIVHRDIKPENVLLNEGTAVVADFGIAKALQVSRTHAPDGSATGTPILTQQGTSLGTPAYMAPEQAVGDPDTDQRADLYAWGVVAYELLAGHHPFASRTTAQQLIAAHIAEVPRALGDAAPAVSPAIAALVMCCLAKDPAERPKTAATVLAQLDAAALAVVGGPRRVRAAWKGALTAIILVAAAIVIVSRGRSAPPTPRPVPGPVMLAVLPFEHAGPTEQALFTDGLTDAVTAKLVMLPGLAIIDRQSAAQYRRTTKPAKQIGTELGVTWLLEGVVRWAQLAGGAWQAQVTPTLVDARSGTTRWTGTPVVITPADPFTAQSDIATRVAQALTVELRPEDRAALVRRVTSNREAFGAWVRGLAAMEADSRESSGDALRQAAREFSRAVELDSSFAEAWGELAHAQSVLNYFSAGDQAAEARMRKTYERALVHAPEQPQVLLSLAWAALDYDHDTTAADTLSARALAAARNDPDVLRRASGLLSQRQRHDTAYALARHAALLAPRSGRLLSNAGTLALWLRRWDEARRYADAIVALDSTDPRGWLIRLDISHVRGDTAALDAELKRALEHLSPSNDNALLWYMSASGEAHATRLLAMSAREHGIKTLGDSVFGYYAAKADLHLRRGETRRANIHYDSVRSLLAGRTLRGAQAPDLLATRALSEVALGDSRAARRTLSDALAAARRTALRADLTDVISPLIVAAVYARLGEPEAAVRWLEAGIAAPVGYTARGYAAQASLFVLRGAPAFERFLREHPN